MYDPQKAVPCSPTPQVRMTQARQFHHTDGCQPDHIAIYDTGTFNPTSPYRRYLHDYEEFTEPRTITLAVSTQTSRAFGRGTIYLDPPATHPNTTPIKITNVWYMPDFQETLIPDTSITTPKRAILTRMRQHHLLTYDKYDNILHSTPFMHYDHIDKKTVIDWPLRPISTLHTVHFTGDNTPKPRSSPQPFDITTWHQRFGHLNFQTLKLLPNYLDDMKITRSSRPPTKCTICIQAMMTRTTFKKTHMSRTQRPLSRIYSDLSGRLRVPSCHHKYQYFAPVIDDYTRYLWLFLLKNKSDYTSRFTTWSTLITNELDSTIQELHVDGGGEFVNKALEQHCNQHGIHIRTTIRHTSEQNSIAETIIRRIWQGIRCLLMQANLPIRYWAHAAEFFTFLHNRTPHRATLPCTNTPYYALYDKRPSAATIRTFGCLCFVYNDQKNRGKIEPRSIPCIFLGYPTNKQGYKILRADTEQILYSHTVQFIEFADDEHQNLRNQLPLRYEGDELYEKAYVLDGTAIPRTHPLNPPIIHSATPLPSLLPLSITSTSHTQHNHTSSKPTPKRVHFADNSTTNTMDASQGSNKCRKRRPKAASPPTSPKRRLNVSYVNRKTQLHRINTNTSSKFPRNYREARKRPDWPHWLEAMRQEYLTLLSHNTFRETHLPPGAKLIPSRFVYVIKYDIHGALDRYKARLVALGYNQEAFTDYDPFTGIYSPVTCLDTIRTMLVLAVQLRLKINQQDATGAYLHGKIDKQIFLQKPAGFADIVGYDDDRVLELLSNLYGLKQAGRIWNDHFVAIMLKLGYRRCNSDTSVFVLQAVDGFIFFALYIDDFLIFASNTHFMRKCQEDLAKHFQMKDLGTPKGLLGLHIEYDAEHDRLYLDQQQYLRKILHNFTITEDHKSVSTPIIPGSTREYYISTYTPQCQTRMKGINYRKAVGQLMYLMRGSRLDLCTVVSLLSKHLAKPSWTNWLQVQYVFRYLLGTQHFRITYTRRPNWNQDWTSIFTGYADASYADDPTTSLSRGGFILMALGGPVRWWSKQLVLVSMSTMVAEYVTAALVAQELMALRWLLDDLGFPVANPFVLHEDNQPAINLAQNPMTTAKSKYIPLRYHFVRERIRYGDILLSKIPTADQLADICTKGLPPTMHKRLVSLLGLSD